MLALDRMAYRPEDESYNDWDGHPAGVVTDFVVVVCCAVCGFLAVRRCQGLPATSKATLEAFALFAFFTSSAFLFGGTSHAIVGFYAASGASPLGKTWTSKNNAWMFLWLPAVALQPLAALGNLTYLPAAAGCPRWVTPAILSVGAVFSVVEIAILTNAELMEKWSGASSLLLFVSVALVNSVWAIVNAARGAAAMWIVALGNVLIMSAWLFMLSPKACLEYSNPDRICPWPNDFNQNAIMHTILAPGVIIVYLGLARYVDIRGPFSEQLGDGSPSGLELE